MPQQSNPGRLTKLERIIKSYKLKQLVRLKQLNKWDEKVLMM